METKISLYIFEDLNPKLNSQFYLCVESKLNHDTFFSNNKIWSNNYLVINKSSVESCFN
jgi:hypothetical protein